MKNFETPGGAKTESGGEQETILDLKKATALDIQLRIQQIMMNNDDKSKAEMKLLKKAKETALEVKKKKEIERSQELSKLSKEDGVRRLLPNDDLPGLEIDGLFCTNYRKVEGEKYPLMVGPEAPNSDAGSTLIHKGAVRGFASWEMATPIWHADESKIKKEMAEIDPDNPDYRDYIKGESFSGSQQRKERIIRSWELMKENEETEKGQKVDEQEAGESAMAA